MSTQQLRSIGLVLLISLLGVLPPVPTLATVPRPAQSQHDPITNLRQKSDSAARVSYHLGTGKVRFIGLDPSEQVLSPLSPHVAPMSPAAAAEEFISVYGPAFGLSYPDRELIPISATTGDRVRTFLRYQQIYQGIPVFGGELIVQVNARNQVVSANGEVLPDIQINPMPTIDAASARQSALAGVAKWYSVDVAQLTASDPVLWIYNPVLVGPGPRFTHLVWRMEVIATDLRPVRELVLVDTERAAIVLHFNQIDNALDRRTYTADRTSNLPGWLVCDESDPGCTYGDAHAHGAHLGASFFYTFAANFLGRDGIDDAGMPIISTVHACPSGVICPYDGAFWNGNQVVYGDKYAFPLAVDIVAHELGHAMLDHQANLFYFYQSGAISESLADVWGEFVDLTYDTDSVAVRWLIGEDVTGHGAFRSMSYPSDFGDPDRMTSSLYYTGANDNGGVHRNSGINNKAVYLMTDGGSFNGRIVTGLGIFKVAAIYYEAQAHLLVSGSDYADLYDALYQACLNLNGTHGIDATDCDQVRAALDAVEMASQPTEGFNHDAPLCPVGQTPDNVFWDDLEGGSGNWISSAQIGTDRWEYDSEYFFAHSGVHFLYADDRPASTTDTSIVLFRPIVLPPNAYLHFAHAYAFEGPSYDGGVLEYTTDNGSTIQDVGPVSGDVILQSKSVNAPMPPSWQDAGPLFDAVGYSGVISASYGNPLAGRDGFVGDSHGYISSRVNLSSLAGNKIRLRWRMGLDSSGFYWGWWLDDVRIYTCSVNPSSYELIVTKVGDGSGVVMSDPAGIDCGDTCTADFVQGAQVTLSATPSASSIFAGWSGSCSGAATCVVTMDQVKAITVTFKRTVIYLPLVSK